MAGHILFWAIDLILIGAGIIMPEDAPQYIGAALFVTGICLAIGWTIFMTLRAFGISFRRKDQKVALKKAAHQMRSYMAEKQLSPFVLEHLTHANVDIVSIMNDIAKRSYVTLYGDYRDGGVQGVVPRDTLNHLVIDEETNSLKSNHMPVASGLTSIKYTNLCIDSKGLKKYMKEVVRDNAKRG